MNMLPMTYERSIFNSTMAKLNEATLFIAFKL